MSKCNSVPHRLRSEPALSEAEWGMLGAFAAPVIDYCPCFRRDDNIID